MAGYKLLRKFRPVQGRLNPLAGVRGFSVTVIDYVIKMHGIVSAGIDLDLHMIHFPSAAAT